MVQWVWNSLKPITEAKKDYILIYLKIAPLVFCIELYHSDIFWYSQDTSTSPEKTVQFRYDNSQIEINIGHVYVLAHLWPEIENQPVGKTGKSTKSRFVEQTLLTLSSSFKCDRIYHCRRYDLGHTLLCYSSRTYKRTSVGNTRLVLRIHLLFLRGGSY